MIKMNTKQVAFSSEQTRFLDPIVTRAADAPGPGEYQGVLAAFGNAKNQRSHNKS